MARQYDGWKREADSDKDYKASARLSALPLPPPEASLRDRCGGREAVLDQVRNDCVGNSVARAIQAAMTVAGQALAPLPSRDWIYYLSGVPDGSPAVDDGRFIRNAFAALASQGWPDEADWSYGTWPAHPGAEAHRAAFDRRSAVGLLFHKITETGEARREPFERAIAHGFPVVGGVQVTDAFEAQSGHSALPVVNAPTLGGHAIAFVSYTPDGIGFANSWGTSFGAEGFGYLSWDWLALPTTSDLWVVEIVPGKVAV